MCKSHCKAHASGQAASSQDLTRGVWSRQERVSPLVRGGMLILLLVVFLIGTSPASSHQRDGGDGSGNDADSGGNSNIDALTAFQRAPCPFTMGAGLVEGQQISCGYLTVPANHTVNTGQTLKLTVAILKAPNYMHSIDPAPVLHLDGGPGGSSIASASLITAQNYHTLVSNHNLILFDQRGAGYSTPSLACPEREQVPTNASLAVIEKAIHACYNRLVSEGINLNNFNTLQSAADVADLIHALGYRQMTLYGVSYGTRLALTVMRLYPQVVRAVVLDSVYPPTHNRNELASTAQRAFTRLFQGCAADATCNAEYPDLQNVFYRLVDQLNAHPISFTYTDIQSKQQVTIPSYTGNDLVSTIDQGLYYASIIPFLPALIYQIKTRDYTYLSAYYHALSAVNTARVFSLGLFFSIECSEDWAFLTQQDVLDSLQGIRPQIAKVLGQEEQAEYEACQFWQVQPVPIAQKQPVHSDLPTLVLAGEYDPVTPPTNAQEVVRNLSHSTSLLFPGVGHGVGHSSTCVDNIISAFEEHPHQALNSACLAQLSEPAFR